MSEPIKTKKCMGESNRRWVSGYYNDEGEYISGKYVNGDGINCRFEPVTETEDVCTYCNETINY
jgi:hypothetical protein